MIKSMWTLPFEVDDKTLEAITSPDADPLLIDLIQTLADMAQPVTPQEAARVLLENLMSGNSDFWVGWYQNGSIACDERLFAALRAIATPPQENALQELADLGQEFDAAPQSGEGE